MCLPIGQRVRALAQLKETFRVKLKKNQSFPVLDISLLALFQPQQGLLFLGYMGFNCSMAQGFSVASRRK